MHRNKILPTILLTHYGDNWIRGSERCLLDLIANIDRKKFRIVLWCNSQILGKAASAFKIKVITTDFTRLFNNTAVFRISDYFRIANIGEHIIDKYDVKLVHANSAAPSLWLNGICREKKIPLISHLHSSYTLKDRIIFGLHKATITVGVSGAVLHGLAKDGIPTSKLKIIRNGLDVKQLLAQQKINIRKQLNLKERDYLVATTASLIHRKGIDLAISAIIKIRKRGIPIHFLVLGEGPVRSELEKIIRDNNASDFVHLYGESDNIVGILRGGVNLFISTTKEESFGLSIAEASLSSLPVVAPNIGEIPTIVKNNLSGKLYPRHNERYLIESIVDIYKNRVNSRNMGTCGFRHIISHYDIRKYINEFENLYSDTIVNNIKHPSSNTKLYLSIIPRSIALSFFGILRNSLRYGATS